MILTVGNVKGGVGKTTLAVNIAITRALAGRDVLLVDGDEQGTAAAFTDLRAGVLGAAGYTAVILAESQRRQPRSAGLASVRCRLTKEHTRQRGSREVARVARGRDRPRPGGLTDPPPLASIIVLAICQVDNGVWWATPDEASQRHSGSSVAPTGRRWYSQSPWSMGERRR